MKTGHNTYSWFHILPIVLLLLSMLSVNALAASSPLTAFGDGWRANIGFGSSRLNNVIGLSREFPLDENWKLFLGCGAGEILVGGGVSYQQNPGKEGFFASFNAGLVGVHVNGGYQFEVGSRSLLILGAALGSGHSFIGKSAGAMYPIVTYEYMFKSPGNAD